MDGPPSSFFPTGQPSHKPLQRPRPPPTVRNWAPMDCACSRTAVRVSNTRTTAPSDLAAPTAARPATPPPMTSTLAGGMRPAAVIWPVKKRPAGKDGCVYICICQYMYVYESG